MNDKYWIYGLGIALIIGGVISLFASSNPDGLEKVAMNIFGGEEKLNEHTEGKEVIESPMPDYAIPGIQNETLAASLAGVIGVLLVFILVIVIGMLLKNKNKNKNNI
jgi:cobalt/nickel transport protein